MMINALGYVVALLATTGTAMSVSKRAYSGQTLYAYGTNISGLPLYAGSNGDAYISDSPATDLSNVTMTIARGGTVPWNATLAPNNGTTPGSGYKFYIMTTSNAFLPVGFAGSNKTLSSGAKTTGFTLYGSDVMFISGSTYESQFWAQATDVEGVWKLMWNVDGSSETDSVPVTLKIADS